MIKKIITTAVISTALLMGASKMANADSMGVVKAKADHFAMVTTALKTEIELFIIMPDSHSLDKINNLYPKFANAVAVSYTHLTLPTNREV